MKKETTVDILGRTYKILFRKRKEDTYMEQENLDGYCNVATAEIVCRDYIQDPDDHITEEIAEFSMQKILRHELIHAFLHESGLWASSSTAECWAMQEEMVDWIALQMPKMITVMKEVGCL